MKKLIIKKIMELNKKHIKVEFGKTIDTFTETLLENLTDEFLLETYEIYLRYDEEERLRKFIYGKLPLED